MSALTSLARARALEAGRAVPIATVRHVHLAERPLVLIPLTLAGEANAPLAAMVGTSEDSPQLLVVPQARNRDLRFRFAAELASTVMDHGYEFTRSMQTVGKANVFTDAPQLLVPNPAGIAFTRLFGRSTRFRRTTGEYAVDPPVPLLGRWLTFFAERSEHPGSSMLLAMTSALAQHWASGQSALEDANLAALMGWIEPWDGLTGEQAAREAEDPVKWPPAGPSTDPSFDNEILTGLVRAYDASASGTDPSARERAVAALTAALRTQLEPTWRLMWRAVSLLRSLPVGASVADRWLTDRKEFTNFVEYLEGGGHPQAKRDHAVRAAQRLNALEREQDALDVARAFDDVLVMAEHRVTGEAFLGQVVARDPARSTKPAAKRVLRPLLTVRTHDPVRFEPGAMLKAPTRPGQTATVLAVDFAGGWTDVILELSGGMGQGLTAKPDSIPELGETLCYSTLTVDGGQWPTFPARDQTPWTHGGPPAEYVPTPEDAVEVWA